MRRMDGLGTGTNYGVHADNLKNLVRGIVERVFFVNRNGVLAPPPRPVANVFQRLHGLRDRLVRHLSPTAVVSYHDYWQLYSGRKQVVYKKACETLSRRSITPRDAVVDTFTKAEKVNFSSKPDPAPRVIQPRSPRYNVMVGCYLKLFEKELIKGFEKLEGYPVILKGQNATQVAETMRSNWESFRDPVAIGLDASRFDQHVSVQALKYEHSIYNQVFRSPELERLLRWQLYNRGIARVEGHVVRYSVRGCRMSGDINTGMGNCAIMTSIVLAYLEYKGLRARLSNNGDDCVLILERSDIPLLDGLAQWFLEFGFTLTQEPLVEVFERIEFCQAQPVFTASGWRMVRNPVSAPSKDSLSLLGWTTEDQVRNWADAIGTCGLELTRGVPFWEAYYRRLANVGKESRTARAFVRECGMGYMASGVQGCDIVPEARVSFYKAFGMLPDEQVALEDSQCLISTTPPATMMKVQPHLINITSPIQQWARSSQTP